MRTVFVFLLALLTACGSSTGPSKAGDPSLLFTNDTGSWIYVTWRDGAAIEGKDSVAPRTNSQCVRFLAQPDSAYWDIKIDDPIGGPAEATAPYFSPAARPAWLVTITAPASGTVIRAVDTDTPC